MDHLVLLGLWHRGVGVHTTLQKETRSKASNRQIWARASNRASKLVPEWRVQGPGFRVSGLILSFGVTGFGSSCGVERGAPADK